MARLLLLTVTDEKVENMVQDGVPTVTELVVVRAVGRYQSS